MPDYLPSLKPRLFEWVKSGGYVKGIKNVCNERGTVGFFYYYCLKVAVTLPSFTANQMLETPAQMVSFDAFFLS